MLDIIREDDAQDSREEGCSSRNRRRRYKLKESARPDG